LALGLYEDEVAKGRGGATARGDGGGANPAAALSSARGRGKVRWAIVPSWAWSREGSLAWKQVGVSDLGQKEKEKGFGLARDFGLNKRVAMEYAFAKVRRSVGPVSYPGLRKWNQSLHTCAQDVQFTRTVTI
jgi:hypothetical protein